MLLKPPCDLGAFGSCVGLFGARAVLYFICFCQNFQCALGEAWTPEPVQRGGLVTAQILQKCFGELLDLSEKPVVVSVFIEACVSCASGVSVACVFRYL